MEQAVGMVHADTRNLAVADQFPQQRMRRFEDIRDLDPDAREGVDVEEPAVVDLVRGRSPVRKPIGLRFEQFVERVEALGLPRFPLNRAIAAWIRWLTSGDSSTSRASRPRATSFSRWRSATRSCWESVCAGKFSSEDTMLSSSLS